IALCPAQRGSQTVGNFTRTGEIAGFERNGRDARMAAAAELLRKGSQVLIGSRLIPRIGAQRDFRTNRGSTDAYGIHTFRVQEVGNEFVVALQIHVADIEEYDTIA